MTNQPQPFDPDNPPEYREEDILIRRSMLDTLWARFVSAPWWIIIMVLIFIYAGIQIADSEQYQDIFYTLIDNPHLTTEDKFDVVYEVDTEVIILARAVNLILPDGDRLTIAEPFIETRQEGTLACDQAADPDCVEEFGEIATYREPLAEDVPPDGTMVLKGILRPIGNVLELPDGTVLFVDEAAILERAPNGTLACNRLIIPDCAPLEGEVVTAEVPYILKQGRITRDDVLIEHSDGFQDIVRPNRLDNIRTEACTVEDTPQCTDGEIILATFEERIIGTETGRDDGQITVRTVDEVTEFIPTQRIMSLERNTVTCDREANPRCTDFEGTIVEQRGAITRGELTVETNRAVNIIPEGQTSAIEIRKSRIEEDIRTPENCRPEDEGRCLIEVHEEDSIVSGRVLEDTDEGLLIQTVAPVFIQIPDESNDIRRAPQTCALNNIRGCNAGIWLTLLVTLVSYSIALVLGLIFGLMRVSANPILRQSATLYVEIIRGTPLLVLLLFFAFVIGPQLRDTETISILGLGIPVGVVTGPFYDFINRLEVLVLGEESLLAEAILGLSIGYGAFLAEVFRAGIESIGKGQMEAARSLGMSYPQAMRKIILPQALRVVLPPLGNDFIAMLKDSALISVLALPDLLQVGRLYVGRTFQPIPTYVMVGLLYILATLMLSAMVRYLERRFRLP